MHTLKGEFIVRIDQNRKVLNRQLTKYFVLSVFEVDKNFRSAMIMVRNKVLNFQDKRVT